MSIWDEHPQIDEPEPSRKTVWHGGRWITEDEAERRAEERAEMDDAERHD